MCDTCGCSGIEGGYKIFKPGEINDNPIITLARHQHGSHSHSHDNHHYYTHSHSENHESIEIEQDILAANNKMAERNRGYFEAKNIFSLNLVSSPGSGKTSLLEKTIKEAGNKFTCYVIEGDQQTDNDAQRIVSTGADVLQINTGNACHLDANMVHDALHQFKVKESGIVFIENVGNLVCPAMFDLGESKRVVIFSITEGEDKPLKYPNMFHTADVCIMNKMDLLPYLDFNLELARKNILRVNPQAEIIELSVKDGNGFANWIQWLENNKT